MDGKQAAWDLTAREDFEAVFREHFPPVHRFIARRVGKGLAEDLAAEVFATAYRRRAAYHPERGSLRSWLFGIAANVMRRYWRDEQQLLELDARVARDLLGPLPVAQFADAADERVIAARYVMHGARRTPGWRNWGHWRPRGRRVTITALAGIVAVVAAALVAVVTQGRPTLTDALTTSWQPARLLPGSAHLARAPSGTWRLMSYLVTRGWQENTAGPEPGWLTCPTATTCYVEGDNSTSPSGPSDMNSFYVSTDGAQTWNVLPVPDHVTFTSALSCASETDCAAGGLYYGQQPVYLTTANGGHSWTVRPLPADVGQIINLDCVTTMTCRGLASASGQLISQGFDLMSDMHFVVTSDGGRRFTVVPFPKGTLIESVTCPTASHCVAVGFHTNFSPRMGPDLDHGVLLTSDDDGMTWRQRTWPDGYGPGPQPDVTCADASHCAMIGFVERNGKVISPGIGYTSGKTPCSTP